MTVPLKPGDSLPDGDHVLRYVAKNFVDNEQIDGHAFLSRPAEKDDGPSINWMEYFDGDIAAQIEEIRRVKRITYEKRGRVARLNVGNTKAYLREQAQHLVDFIYDPLPEDMEKWPADPSHAYLSNVPVRPKHDEDMPEREAIGDMIADCIIESWAVTPDKAKR
jgi:hypothetical protein